MHFIVIYNQIAEKTKVEFRPIFTTFHRTSTLTQSTSFSRTSVVAKDTRCVFVAQCRTSLLDSKMQCREGDFSDGISTFSISNYGACIAVVARLFLTNPAWFTFIEIMLRMRLSKIRSEIIIV